MPSSATLTNVIDGAIRTVTANVTVPAGTPPGNYPVTLKATDNGSGVARSNTATVTVVDTTAPTISIGSPTDGVVFTQNQQITASYSCADEPNGSGLASCAGSVADGAAIDTSTPGTFSFTVTGTDQAGNTASATRTYSVARPPVVVAATPPGRVNVTLAFLYPSAARTTKFTLLQVKGVPSGSTVTATCKGGGCPTKKIKGKKKNVVFTKTKASGTVNLTAFRGRALRPGAVLTVTVTKPGSFGMVKKLTVKKNKKPTLSTTCLQPNSTTAKASCSG
jgi:hypothetical protein